MKSLLKTLLYKAGYSIKKIRPAARVASSGGGSHGGTPDILSLLHATNPYEGFDYAALPLDAHGWGGDSPRSGNWWRRKSPASLLRWARGKERPRCK